MKYLYLWCLLMLTGSLHAQDFSFGDNSHDDLAIKNSIIDSNANAIVLKEFGTARMNHDEYQGYLYIDYVYHVRIKIFNKQGFDQANVVIPLHIYSDRQDDISEIRAVTLNFVNGNFRRDVLDPKKVFTEKRSKYTSLVKFTMPNLMDGSIIEYSYHIKIPSIYNFKRWEFQSSIPKLHSEFIAFVPGLYNYNLSLRGPLKITSQEAVVEKGCLRLNGNAIDCSKMTYIMKNIPAFVEEDYMTAASNFKSAMNYELSDYILLNGTKRNVTKTWKDVESELLSDKSFGAQMKKKEAFKELLPGIIGNAQDELAKANAIYDYIAKNIKSNGYRGMYSETAVKKALETHSGNTGDINLALVSALSAAGLDVEAVILSTRDNGEANPLYPVISDFNYVVAKVNIADQSYLLDASVPMLPFGLLPIDCINGNGRVINLKKPSYWYEIKASQNETTRYNLTATLGKDGKITGELITFSSGYAALKKRKAIAAAGSIDEYVEKLDEGLQKMSIKKHQIINLDSLNKPLIEKYEIEIKAYNHTEVAQLFFNPFFINSKTKNPFNLNERTYPVDLGSKQETRTSIILNVPDDFVLVDQPKNISIGLPENGGRYMTTFNFNDQSIVFNELLQLNKAIYNPNDYLYLKELFSRIIQNQKTDLIFKKAK